VMYPEPYKTSSAFLHPMSPRFILILFCHLCLGLQVIFSLHIFWLKCIHFSSLHYFIKPTQQPLSAVDTQYSYTILIFCKQCRLHYKYMYDICYHKIKLDRRYTGRFPLLMI
jgi:hypothetical protein